MNSRLKKYTYLNVASREINSLFNKHQFFYVDFSSFNQFGDEYYLDGLHCNRNVYYAMINILIDSANPDFDNNFEVNKELYLSMKKYYKN